MFFPSLNPSRYANLKPPKISANLNPRDDSAHPPRTSPAIAFRSPHHHPPLLPLPLDSTQLDAAVVITQPSHLPRLHLPLPPTRGTETHTSLSLCSLTGTDRPIGCVLGWPGHASSAAGVQLPGRLGVAGARGTTAAAAGEQPDTGAAVRGRGGGGGAVAAGVAAGLAGDELLQLWRVWVRVGHAVAAAVGAGAVAVAPPAPPAVPGVGGELAVAGAGHRGVPPRDARPRPGPPRVRIRALAPRHRRAPPVAPVPASRSSVSLSSTAAYHRREAPPHNPRCCRRPRPRGCAGEEGRARRRRGGDGRRGRRRQEEAGEEAEDDDAEAAEPEPGTQRQPRHRLAHQALPPALHGRRQEEEGLAQARRRQEEEEEEAGEEGGGAGAGAGAGGRGAGGGVVDQERVQRGREQQPDQQHRQQQ